MTTRIYSYNPYSASAKALAEALGVKRIKHENSRYRPRVGDTIINWGSSKLPDKIEESSALILNDPLFIGAVSNKLKFFSSSLINTELTVPYTTERQDVVNWLSEGKTVVARTVLNGHSGDGIVVIEPGQEIVDAPLYTLYVPKKDEYRVHVHLRRDGAAQVFDIQRKAKRNDVPKEEANYRIRNLAGGFIYARSELNVPQCVKDVAIQVFHATGLDFGAIDIIYNEKNNRAYALEVNTAPGLTGTTLQNYVDMFKELIDG